MDWLMEIINILIKLFQDGFAAGSIIAALIAAILILVGKYFPSSKLDEVGFKHGQKISAKGNQHKFIGESYEEIEKTFLGSLFAYVSGLKRGLELDNPVEEE